MTVPADDGTHAPAEPSAPGYGRPRWERRYAAVLPLLDAVMIAVAAYVALELRFSTTSVVINGVPYDLLLAAFAPAWVLVLATARCYESRLLGQGTDEYKRLLGGSWRFAALLAVASYAGKTEIARGFVGIVLPLGTLLLLLGRNAARRVLSSQRRRGRAQHRLVVVGPPGLVADVVREVQRRMASGFAVVGACSSGPLPAPLGVPVLGPIEEVVSVAAGCRADAVAVVGAADLPAGFLRRLGWQLEGTGTDLLVAPSITDVAGPRIHVRPVASLSLLYVEEPHFSGVSRVAKAGLDRLGALLLLLVLSPLLLAAAVAVRFTSPGPVFFRQSRLGHGGYDFRVLKFRTMVVGAEAARAALVPANDADGKLFKLQQDPRVTRVGRVLRRLSIDELPQLINVLAGQMSLVGPRPLPESLEAFAAHERRRMLVKPGMTGLWQVSGRSDLDWEESVRLDLYYVENWSLSLDVLILARTVAVVLRGNGAY